MNLGSRKNVGLLALGALLMQETNQGKNFTHSYYNKPRTSQGGGRTKKQKNRKRAANKSKRANRKK